MNRKAFQAGRVAGVVSAAAMSALAFPTLAFAAEEVVHEDTGGISAILPDMLEFIPMLIAFIILWIILAKFGWPMFNGMLEKRENTIISSSGSSPIPVSLTSTTAIKPSRRTYRSILPSEV